MCKTEEKFICKVGLFSLDSIEVEIDHRWHFYIVVAIKTGVSAFDSYLRSSVVVDVWLVVVFLSQSLDALAVD